MRTFIENYLHFMKNCKRPHYEKLKSLKSGFIENSIFENNRDPWLQESGLRMGNFRQNVQDQLPKSRHFNFAYNAFQDVMAKEPPEQSSLSE